NLLMTTPQNRRFLLTPAQMAEADKAAIRGGVAGVALMEAAGAAVAEAVARHWTVRPVLIACGPGNNGGDGFVAARHLRAAGWPVRVGIWGSKDSLAPDAAHHAKLWQGPVAPLCTHLLEGAGLVVDALLGAGL